MNMISSARPSFHPLIPIAVSLAAIAYVALSPGLRAGLSQTAIIAAALHAAEMFYVGMLPIVTVVIYQALTRPHPAERRACLIGAAIAAAMLIPLTQMVF